MSASTTELVWVRSRSAQGGHLRRSLRASLTVGEQPLDVLSHSSTIRSKKRSRRAGGGTPPAVTAQPTYADFGSTTVGTPTREPVTITNNGTTPLTIADDGIVGDGFTLVDSNGDPIVGDTTLAPGNNTVNVEFDPNLPGTFAGAIEVINAAGEIVGLIPLVGVGELPV